MSGAMDEAKVGVYVCHCGGNISDVVDVKAVAAELGKHPQVAISKEFAFMCSDAGQKLVIEDIKSGKINRVVVAACSPALHELTFRKALQRADLNPYLYEHVNIREQVSWVHKGDHDAATRKATSLTRAGVEKILRQDRLESIHVGAAKRVLIVGGGPAGLKAALDSAARGLKVTLVEKSGRLGGHLHEFDTVYPGGQSASELLGKLLSAVSANPAITVVLGAEVKTWDGFVGNFKAVLSTGDAVNAGAVIMATGYRHTAPSAGEYRFGKDDRVITLPALIEQMKAAPRGPLTRGGRAVRSVAFIHCVGSRQIEGVHAPQEDGKVNDYCSRVCCTAALHTINALKERQSDLAIYDLYRDIRTYGRGHEAIYEQASKNGVLFFRFTEEAQPEIRESSVVVKDVLTWNQEVELPADLVVLVTGVKPGEVAELTAMMKLPTGSDRFLQEAHPKLRPVEVANNGFFLAGACQAPMDLVESAAAAGAAASKVAAVLSKDFITLDPYVARVDAEKCTGCEACLPECAYTGALFMNGSKKAEVNAALCKGCGACVAVCEPRALDLAGWSLDQMEAMVDAMASEVAP
ncbi:MAG: CoB--CoM heterodisulfide reductase iron-sulfur subunit A family protein [Spirochaetes bacterium]|nr:CoB--CoM heterodisulfide reductase iron-sulfur subunit A family protein [Spirochaetota bacterium]